MNKNIFIDREKELRVLKDAFSSEKAELILIYGRRRIGKTTLILYASRELDRVYLYVDYAKPSIILRNFSRELFKKLQLPEGVTVEDFEALFKVFSKIDVVILDEFQRLQDIDPSIITTLQKIWDLELSRGKSKMVIVGSSIGLIERIGLSPSAPLFGRVTRVIELKEMSYRAVRAFYPQSSEENRIRYYAVLGGVPAYHRFFEEKLGFIENIRKNIFETSSPLYGEVERLLREETRDPTPYMSILAAISLGKNTFSEIADYTGIEKTSLPRYLQTLKDNLKLVKVIQALGTTGRRFRRYTITSNFFKFWFRYIYPHRGMLEEGNTKAVLDLVEDFKPHIAEVFEDVCKEHFTLLNRQGLVKFTNIGKWWQKGIEIDWIAVDERSSTVFFIECKWTDKPAGREILNKLIRKSEYFPWRRDKRRNKYVIYSKSGFTWRSDSEDVVQISLKEIEKTFDEYKPPIGYL